VKRVLVLGNAGAGKSWLASRLGARHCLTVVHLDQLFWKPGWVAREPDVFAAAVDKALPVEGAWVADGNYLANLPMRMARADTIVVLDIPTWRCLGRVMVRSVQSRTRPDMAPGCEENPLRRHYLEFLAYVLRYRRDHLPRVLAALEDAHHARVVVLRTEEEVVRLLSVTEG
jgi:adenylate kinase family enzyme